jgi:hypothetical protein
MLGHATGNRACANHSPRIRAGDRSQLAEPPKWYSHRQIRPSSSSTSSDTRTKPDRLRTAVEADSSASVCATTVRNRLARPCSTSARTAADAPEGRGDPQRSPPMHRCARGVATQPPEPEAWRLNHLFGGSVATPPGAVVLSPRLRAADFAPRGTVRRAASSGLEWIEGGNVSVGLARTPTGQLQSSPSTGPTRRPAARDARPRTRPPDHGRRWCELGPGDTARWPRIRSA